MIINRENHNLYSRYIIQESAFLKRVIIYDYFLICLRSLALSHKYQFDIEDLPKTIYNIRIQLISSIFRIIDSLDLTSERCPKEVFDIIQKSDSPMSSESVSYWKSHQAIKSIIIEKDAIIIVAKNSDANLLIEHLQNEISKVKKYLSVAFQIPKISIIYES
jgi:hypothetical protein